MVLFIIKLVFYFTSNTASFRLGLLLSLSKDFQSLASHSLHGGITENVENHFAESLSKNKCLITTSKVRLGQDRRFSHVFRRSDQSKESFRLSDKWNFWRSDRMTILTKCHSTFWPCLPSSSSSLSAFSTKWSNEIFDEVSFDVLTLSPVVVIVVNLIYLYQEKTLRWRLKSTLEVKFNEVWKTLTTFGNKIKLLLFSLFYPENLRRM